MPEILVYHSISDNENDIGAVSPSTFEADMEMLNIHGYRGISLRQFYENRRIEKAIILTFDDGYRDFITNAVPVLNRFKFSATIFIVTEHIAGISRWRKEETQYPLMNWDKICELNGLGYEIGSHGLYHRRLTLLLDDALKNEIVKSKSDTEKYIRKPVDAFAYPWCLYDDRVISVVKSAGYKYAVNGGHSPDQDFDLKCFCLNRKSINKNNSLRRILTCGL